MCFRSIYVRYKGEKDKKVKLKRFLKSKRQKVTLQDIIKSIKHRKHIEFGSLEEFYDFISSFIEYPTLFLPELARKFEHELEDVNDIKRLIGLLKLDNCALDIAYSDGIHPITGAKWTFENDKDKRYQLLVERNLKMIKYLESMLEVLETKY